MLSSLVELHPRQLPVHIQRNPRVNRIPTSMWVIVDEREPTVFVIAADVLEVDCSAGLDSREPPPGGVAPDPLAALWQHQHRRRGHVADIAQSCAPSQCQGQGLRLKLRIVA